MKLAIDVQIFSLHALRVKIGVLLDTGCDRREIFQQTFLRVICCKTFHYSSSTATHSPNIGHVANI